MAWRANLFLVSVFITALEYAGASSLDQWNARDSGTGNNINSVAYGSNRFIAVGQNGMILVSSNAATWNIFTSSVIKSLYGVTWGNNLFVAVGDEGSISTSSDGVTWVSQASPTTNHLKSVEFLGARFFAVGANGTLLSSSNCSLWEAHNSGSSMVLEGIASGNGIFCAVGGQSTHNSSIPRSLDGLTWSNQTIALGYLADVTYGNGVFVANGVRSQIFRSSDAINWTQHQAGNSEYLYDTVFAQGMFVSVGGPFGGGGQKIVTSPNGIQWTPRTENVMHSGLLQGVAYGNGYFVAVGQKGLILQSAPVFGLTPATPPAAGGFQWILTGEIGRTYSFQFSPELGGTNWTEITNFISVNETTFLTDPATPLSFARFYRVISP